MPYARTCEPVATLRRVRSRMLVDDPAGRVTVFVPYSGTLYAVVPTAGTFENGVIPHCVVPDA